MHQGQRWVVVWFIFTGGIDGLKNGVQDDGGFTVSHRYCTIYSFPDGTFEGFELPGVRAVFAQERNKLGYDSCQADTQEYEELV